MLFEYRAWNKEKSIMVYDNEDDSEEYFDGLFSPVSMSNYVFSKNQYSHYVWLPFTGRFDDSKGHKKIYSADFIKRVYRRKDASDFIGEVKFDNGRWVLVDSERKCIDLYEGDVFEDFILGNSYESSNKTMRTLIRKSDSF